MRHVALPVLLPLVGCAWLDQAAKNVADAVDPIVAVGLVERVEAPTDLPGGVVLPEGLQVGTGAEIFLADARSVDEIGDAPVEGATLVLSGCGGDVDLHDDGNGSYSALGVLPGCDGPYEVDRTDIDPPSLIPVALPAEQDPGVDPTWTAGEDMVLDLSGADWNGAVIVVANVAGGDVTYDNRPTDVRGWYQLLEGQQDLSAVTIPGSAFEADADHVVAVTGLLRTKKGTLRNVNTILSTVDGGRTTLHLVTTRAR